MVTSASIASNGRAAEPIPGEPTAIRPGLILGPDGHPLTYSWDNLLTMQIAPARQIIAGLIEEQTGNILGGVPNAGKSWIAVSQARAVASGTDWLGHFATQQGTVLIIDEESHLPGVVARAKMLEAANPLGPDLPVHFAVGRGLRLDNSSAEELDRDMARLKPTLVILDSLTRIHGANENDAGQMADVFANAKQLMRKHGAAFLFTDHVRKLGPVSNDPEERLRGSTEKRAWPDAIFAADPIKDEPTTALTFTHTKSRHGRKLDPFKIRLEIDSLAGTAQLVHAGEASSTDAPGRGGDILRAIHDVKKQLGPDGADLTCIAAWLSCSSETVRRNSKPLVQAGLITARKIKSGQSGGQPKTVYDVVGSDETGDDE